MFKSIKRKLFSNKKKKRIADLERKLKAMTVLKDAETEKLIKTNSKLESIFISRSNPSSSMSSTSVTPKFTTSTTSTSSSRSFDFNNVCTIVLDNCTVYGKLCDVSDGDTYKFLILVKVEEFVEYTKGNDRYNFSKVNRDVDNFLPFKINVRTSGVDAWEKNTQPGQVALLLPFHTMKDINNLVISVKKITSKDNDKWGRSLANVTLPNGHIYKDYILKGLLNLVNVNKEVVHEIYRYDIRGKRKGIIKMSPTSTMDNLKRLSNKPLGYSYDGGTKQKGPPHSTKQQKETFNGYLYAMKGYLKEDSIKFSNG